MEIHDLANHGKAQSQTGTAFPGGIYLIKPLPDSVLFLRRNADAVVLHGQDGFLFLCGQRQTDVPVFPAVFSGVVQQVNDDPGDEEGIKQTCNAVLNPGFQGNASRAGVLLFAQNPCHFAQIGRFPLQLLRAQIQPGNIQKAADEQRHFFRLAMDDGDGFPVVFQRRAMLFGIAALGQNDGGGSAQFMGGVRGKLLFRLKGLLQAGKHPVKGTGQPPHFIPAFRNSRPQRQILPPADALRRVGDTGDGGQGPSGDEPAAGGGQQNEKGEHNGKQRKHIACHLPAVRAAQDAPEPQPVVPAGRNPEIQYIVVRTSVCTGNKFGNSVSRRQRS